jgi:hypothetical protein
MICASPGVGPGAIGGGHLDIHVVVGSDELGKAVEAKYDGLHVFEAPVERS